MEIQPLLGLVNFKKAFHATAVILLLLTASAARSDDKLRTISVSGTVETKVAPDQVVWQISLTAADPVLGKAKEHSDEQAKAVVALQEKLGIAKGDLQTGLISVNRDFEHTPRGERGNFKQFVVSRSITIRQRDLKRFDEFLNTLLASTDMEVYFNFEASRTPEIRANARLQALRVAKEKAAAMADALGARLGKVQSINEQAAAEPWRNPVANNLNVDRGSSTADVASDTFVPGAISLPVTVYVTFELD